MADPRQDESVEQPKDPNLVPNVDTTAPAAPDPNPDVVSPVYDPTPPTEPTSHKPAPTPDFASQTPGAQEADPQEAMRKPLSQQEDKPEE